MCSYTVYLRHIHKQILYGKFTTVCNALNNGTPLAKQSKGMTSLYTLLKETILYNLVCIFLPTFMHIFLT